jgi:hypothetical protein
MIVSNGIEIRSNARGQQTQRHDIAPDLRFTRDALAWQILERCQISPGRPRRRSAAGVSAT